MEERVTINGGSGGSTYQSKTYQCHLDLFFNDKGLDPMSSNGLGKSKKEARKVGIRHLSTLLIQNGLIKLGIKDKSFLKSSDRYDIGDKSKDSMMNKDIKIDHSLDERNKRLKKEIKRLGKKMQEALKDDNFIEACQFFCQIICNKSPEWNEVAQIWAYAIHKKDIKYIRIILDLILYKRINKDTHDTSSVDIINDSNIYRKEIQSTLHSMYGFNRIRSQNPYDIIDRYNFKHMTHDYHIDNIPTYTETVPSEDIDVSVDNINSRLVHMDIDSIVPPVAMVSQKDALNEGDSDRGMNEYDPSICNLKIDQTTSKEFKEDNINYMNYRLLSEMYEMLMYSGDMQFSIHASEVLYSRSKIDDTDFINPYACYYYSQRRNMIDIDLIESFYKTYLNLYGSTYGFVKIVGNVSKIGYKFKQQVVVFNPISMDSANWDYYVIRRGTTVPRDIHNIRDNTRLNEKEYIILLTLDDDHNNKVDNEFNEVLANDTGNNYYAYNKQYYKYITLDSIKNSYFFNKYVTMGKKVSRIVVGYVIDISKDYSIKLYTLPNTDDTSSFNDPTLKWIMIRLPISGNHHACYQSLEQYTTRICTNPFISHVILSPPLTSKSHMTNAWTTKTNFEQHQSVRIKNQIKNILNNITDKLDDSQLKAVEFALAHSVSLIQSPTCSGKISTLVQIVHAWMNISQSNVLVCAESNARTDMLHFELTNAGINSIRIMTSPDDSDNHHFTQNSIETINKMQDANTHFNAFYVRYPILKKIVSGASVICITLDALVSEYFNSSVFPRVIVDGASSTNESLVIAALTKNCQHLVLFGDQKALPPKTQSEMGASKGYSISLFERYQPI